MAWILEVSACHYGGIASMKHNRNFIDDLFLFVEKR